MSCSGSLAIKRVLDLLAAMAMLVILTIPLLLIGMLIRLDSPGKAVFRQDRIGKNGRKFRIWKFRTMTHDADRVGPQMPPQPDDYRVTRIGHLLRRFGIDELPQLINVVRGDMSLIGPRPMLAYRAELLSKDDMRRHQMRPGITGLAVIRGRNQLTWNEKIELDIWYVDHYSLLVDLRILLSTPWVLLRAVGVHMAPDESLHRGESKGPTGNRDTSGEG